MSRESVGGRFEIGALAGRGGYGEVFRARDLRTGESVAVKRLIASFLDEPARIRFEREANMLARTNSPHVVRYIAHGKDLEGRHFIATEWLDGEPLNARMARDRLTLEQSVHIVEEAALGLGALHALGILHRDVKPGNMFLARENGRVRVKMLDLGIALERDEVSLTAQGFVLGSPVYISPEAIRGEDLSAASDVYSLGVVLFEMLTGQPPFPGRDPLAVLGRVLLEDAPHVTAVRPDLPRALDPVLECALAKDPAVRFATPEHLARAARAALDSLGDNTKVQPRPAVLDAALVEQRVIVVIFAHADEPEATGRIVQAIEAHGGAAQEIRGGRVFGSFGFARSTGNELSQAAEAALAVLSRAPSASVGLATGRALSKGGSLVGDAIDEAAAAFTSAPRGAIRLGPEAARQLDLDFDIDHDGRGATLVCERPAGGVRSRVLLGRATPLVGREHELAVLTAMSRGECAGHAPRSALIIAPQGMGKSRLRAELLAVLAADPLPHQVLSLRGDPLQSQTPYAALTRGLRERARIQDGEARATQSEKLVSLAVPGVSLEFLAELARVSLPGDGGSPALRAARANPGSMAAQLRSTFLEWVRAASVKRPQLIVFDDLHWADRESVDLVSWVVSNSLDARASVLGFTRPEYAQRFPRLLAGATEIRLEPLSARAAEQLVAFALGENSEPSLRRALASRSAGNPLFLEELVRSAAEGRENELPLAIQAAMQSRLDGLDPTVRRVARAASVYGQTFWTEAVSALLPRVDVRAALGSLLQAEVIAARPSSRIAGTREFMFRHQIARDSVYAMLAPDDRAALHRLAGSWLRTIGEGDHATLAHHAELAGELREAIELHSLAARQSASEHALETEYEHLNRALALATDPATRLALLVRRGDAGVKLARTDIVLGDMAEATELAGRDAGMRLEIARHTADAQLLLGHPETAAELLREALDDTRDDSAWLALRLSVTLRRAHMLALRGRAAEALNIARATVDDPTVPEDVLREITPVADQVIGLATLALGDLDDSLATYRSALRRARVAGDPVRAAFSGLYVGFICNQLGMWEEAERLLTEIRDDSRRFRLPQSEAIALHNLGMSLARTGDVAAGLRAEESASAIADRNGIGRVSAAGRMYSALLRVERRQPGDLERAEIALNEAEPLSQPYGPMRAMVAVAQARLHLVRGDIEMAAPSASRAFELLESLGAVDEMEELIRLTYVETLLAIGREREAHTALAVARERLRSKAGRIRDTGLRHSFLTRVPEHETLLTLARQLLGPKG